MSDSTMLPILKDNKDPHYRYKMPKLTAKVEGSGNGIRTVITNMVAVAKALDRPPTYPTKFFGCELGAQVTMNNEYIVNGSHDPDRLLQLLYGFIRMFVLCTKCNNPETSLIVSNQNIRQKCIACGHEAVIPKAKHKLTTFIINHPPESSSGTSAAVNGTNGNGTAGGKSGSKASKSDKKSSKKQNGSGSPTNGTSSSSNGNGKDNGSDDKNGHRHHQEENGDEEDGFDDGEFTAAAYTERLRELRGDGSTNNNMYLNDTKESANLFYKLVKEKKELGELEDAQVQKELTKEAERLEIKDKATLVLSELLFTENIVDEIKKYRILLLRFCHENRKAQKYLLGGCEKLVGDVYKEKLFGQALKIWKLLYDEDIVEEETVLEWAAKVSKKYVSKDVAKKLHEKVEPFVKWLKEAEVEDDDDDDDDDDKVPNGATKTTNGNGNSNGNVSAANQNGKGNERQQSVEEEDDDDEEADDNDDDMFEFSHRVSGIQLEAVKADVPKQPVNAAVVAANGGGGEEDDLDIDQI